MNNTAENLFYLINSPLNVHNHILYFYSQFEGKKNDLFLAYLVLPMCLNKDIRESIKYLKIGSDILSITLDKEKYKTIIGLQQIIDQYKELTNTCLQLDIIRNRISIDYDNNRIILKSILTNYDINTDVAKAIRALAKITDKAEVVDTLKMLGVKEL